jgi:hypothetical protein
MVSLKPKTLSKPRIEFRNKNGPGSSGSSKKSKKITVMKKSRKFKKSSGKLKFGKKKVGNMNISFGGEELFKMQKERRIATPIVKAEPGDNRDALDSQNSSTSSQNYVKKSTPNFFLVRKKAATRNPPLEQSIP